MAQVVREEMRVYPIKLRCQAVERGRFSSHTVGISVETYVVTLQSR